MLQEQEPNTYVNLIEDDINDAANHYEEVKDIPGVPKVALSGKSQRRRVNIQGLNQGGERCWFLGVPKGSPVASGTSVRARKRDGGQTLYPLSNCSGLS